MTALSTYEELRDRLVRAVERGGTDPTVADHVTRAAREVVDAYAHAARVEGRPPLADPDAMVVSLVESVVGFGPLSALFARGDVEEVFLEGGRVSYIGADGRVRALDRPMSDDEVAHIIGRLLAPTDRRLDAATPIVQARVLDGTARLTAVGPPVADRLSATIRRYALRRQTLDRLVALGGLTAEAATLLRLAVAAGLNIVVSGPPGAGKTSLLSALIAEVDGGRCVRACEEVRELHVPIVHGSYYEARPPAMDGGGEVTLRRLVKVILAMRPDMIVVGEVRGAEAFELTRAANAGCAFACTVHANTARDALAALVNAALMAGENVTAEVVRSVFASAIDLIVHLDRDVEPVDPAGLRRQVMEIVAVNPSLGDGFTTESVFSRSDIGGPLRWTGAVPPEGTVRRLERHADGRELRALLGGAR